MDAAEGFFDLIERVDIGEGTMTIKIRPMALLPNEPRLPGLRIQTRLDAMQAGRARPIVLNGTSGEPRRDAELIALVADARRWAQALGSGEATSVQAISEREKLGKGRVSRVLPLAYLAPDLTQAILEGRQPAELTARRLRDLSDLPLNWVEQRKLLGF